MNRLPIKAMPERFPGLLPPIPENIPDELKAKRRWIVWSTEYDAEIDKWTKVPKCPGRPKMTASKNKPSLFGSFDEAYSTYLAHEYLGGVGYIATENDPYTFFDLDKCVTNGVVDPESQKIIDAVCSYTELSPSGRGIRIIAIGKLPGRQVNNRALGRELYDGQKNSFLTITGQVITEQLDIVDAQQEINQYHAEWKVSSQTEAATVTFSKDFYDEFDISKASISTLDLLHGNGWDVYASRSEVLLGVCKDLLRDGFTVDEILSITTSEDFAISQVAASRRPNNRESQRVWIANYSLAKAMAEHQELNAITVDFDQLVQKKSSETKSQKQYFSDIPDFILNPPGIIGEITNWIDENSSKPQRLFAVQSALSFTSAVLSRHYKTTQRNYSPLFSIVLGETGSGKEWARQSIEKLLLACNLESLIGPPWYTSDSGLLSSLYTNPTHICLADEFGLHLVEAKCKNNVRQQSLIRSMMEMFGLCDGTARAQGYSTFGLKNKEDLNRVIHNPCLSIYGVSTQEQFYKSVESGAVKDGFLNRFIIVESDVGIQPRRKTTQSDVYQSIKDWVADVHRYEVQPGGAELSVDPDSNPAKVNPKIIPFSDEADELFYQFDHECVDLAKSHKSIGLGEMFVRTNEIAMRVSLAVALGCNSKIISKQHAQWAIDYVRFYALRAVERLQANLANSQFEAIKLAVLKAIGDSDLPLTEREIAKRVSKFNALPKRGQIEVLESLAFLEEIVSDEKKGVRGPGTRVWVINE
jgi:Protein of unknown function (DUF3987)